MSDQIIAPAETTMYLPQMPMQMNGVYPIPPPIYFSTPTTASSVITSINTPNRYVIYQEPDCCCVIL